MSDNIKVAVRIRPLLPTEKKKTVRWEKRDHSVVQVYGEGTGRNSYTFDNVFDELVTNSAIFESVVKPIVDSSVDGFNGTVFVYGQTSCGKTHTMMGNSIDKGLIPLCINHIFNKIQHMPNRKFLIRVSYIEIYNEKVQDLLNPHAQNIKVHEDSTGNVFVKAMEEVSDSPSQVLDIMKRGEKNRKIATTNMNTRSSRSHTLFRIVIESRTESEEHGTYKVAWLNLVDLAGSERMSASTSESILKEGTFINTSLSALSLVIKQLSEGAIYQNFRDSKLTRILQQSLGGNSKTLIIANITVVSEEETNSTLQFASRAKTIKNKPEINETVEDKVLMKRYENQVTRLKEELKKVQHERDSAQGSTKELSLKNRQLKERIHLMEKNFISVNVDLIRRRHTCGPSDLARIDEDFDGSDAETSDVELSRNSSILSIKDIDDIPSGLPKLEGFEIDLIQTEKHKIGLEPSLFSCEDDFSDDECNKLELLSNRSESPGTHKAALREVCDNLLMELTSLEEWTKLEKKVKEDETLESLKEEMVSYRKQYFTARDKSEKSEIIIHELTEKLDFLNHQLKQADIKPVYNCVPGTYETNIKQLEMENLHKNKEIEALKEEISILRKPIPNGNDLLGEIKKGLTGLTKILTPTESGVILQDAMCEDYKLKTAESTVEVLLHDQMNEYEVKLQEQTQQIEQLKRDLILLCEEKRTNEIQSNMKDETIENLNSSLNSIKIELFNQKDLNEDRDETINELIEKVFVTKNEMDMKLFEKEKNLQSLKTQMSIFQNETEIKLVEKEKTIEFLQNQIYEYENKHQDFEKMQKDVSLKLSITENESKQKLVEKEQKIALLQNQIYEYKFKIKDFEKMHNDLKLQMSVADNDSKVKLLEKDKNNELFQNRINEYESKLQDFEKIQKDLLLKLNITENGSKQKLLEKEQTIALLQNQICEYKIKINDFEKIHNDLKLQLSVADNDSKVKLLKKEQKIALLQNQIYEYKFKIKDFEKIQNDLKLQLSVADNDSKVKLLEIEKNNEWLQNRINDYENKHQDFEKMQKDVSLKLSIAENESKQELLEKEQKIALLQNQIYEYKIKLNDKMGNDAKNNQYSNPKIHCDINVSFKEKHRQALDRSRELNDNEALDPELLMDEINARRHEMDEKMRQFQSLEATLAKMKAEICLKNAEISILQKRKYEDTAAAKTVPPVDDINYQSHLKCLQDENAQLKLKFLQLERNKNCDRCNVKKKDQTVQHDTISLEGSGSGIELLHNLMAAKNEIIELNNENFILKDKNLKLKRLCQYRKEQLKNT